MNKTIQVEYASFAYRVFLRFVRVFLSGFLGTLVIQTVSAPALSTFAEFKVWLVALSIAGMSGGIAALDKAYRN